MLYLEAPPAFAETTNAITLGWRGDASAEARWTFGVAADAREVAVVNASLARENPFYSVGFYHELYFRGRTQTLQDLRVTASQSCRVEIVDALTMNFLAVDANGDGDFEDAGDVLYADANADGYPDFKLTTERDLAAFELRVYPLVRNNSAPQELEVTLWRREAGGWTTDAVDVLQMRWARSRLS